MALPEANIIIHIRNLYPDRVQLAFDYLLSEPISFEAICPTMRGLHGLTKAPRRRALRGRLNLPILGQMTTVEVTKTRSDRPLRFKLDINPLRYRHGAYQDFNGETGCNGTQNWLHPDDISNDNMRLWSLVDDLIQGVSEELTSIVCEIAEETRFGLRASLSSVYIQNLEIAIDLAASDPEGMTLRLGRAIQDQCNSSIIRTYRASPTGYQRNIGEVRMVDGFWSEEDRCKVYAKTNRRVRLESERTSRAINALGLQCDLARYQGGFAELFELVAGHTLEQLQGILRHAEGAPESSHGPLDLLVRIARQTRRPEVAAHVLQTLARRGHVSRDIGTHGLGARLSAAGVLTRIGRNLYGIAPTYHQALQILRATDESWLDFTQDEVQP